MREGCSGYQQGRYARLPGETNDEYFHRALAASDSAVAAAVEAIRREDERWYVKGGDDKEPFENRLRERVRLCDIAALFDAGDVFVPLWVECKDFPALVKYDATGLPKEYIDKKMRVFGADKVLLVFRDNEEYVSNRAVRFAKRAPGETNAQANERSRREVVRQMVSARRARVLADGSLEFLQYGGLLSYLMGNDSIDEPVRDLELEASGKIPNTWGMGVDQYLWRTAVLKPMGQLVREITLKISAASRT